MKRLYEYKYKDFNANDKDVSEEIIVNGVDVSDCACYIVNDPPEGMGTWGGSIHAGACKCKAKDCKDYPDCLFKENKRLKEYVQALQPTGICDICMTKTHKYNDKLISTIKDIADIARKIEDDGCPYGDYNCDNCNNDEDFYCKIKARKLILEKCIEGLT